MASKLNPLEPGDQKIAADFVVRNVLNRVERSSLFGLSISGGLLVLVGLLDYLTGYEIGFALFYLFPVMLSTWAAGRRAGIVTAAVSALLWLVVDYTAGHPYREPLSPFWNAAMRLGIFAVVAQLVMYLRNLVEFERSMSRTDHLTGIANRRAFTEALGRENIRSERFHQHFSLAYIDIDNFKKLNDEEGHKVGDEALCVIAETLNGTLSKVDLVSRIGGDEFAILLLECDRAAATEVVSRCMTACSKRIQSHNWPIGLSVGVAVFNGGGRTIDELLACADQVMYQSKRSGKNRISCVTFEELDAGKTPYDIVETDKERRSKKLGV